MVNCDDLPKFVCHDHARIEGCALLDVPNEQENVLNIVQHRPNTQTDLDQVSILVNTIEVSLLVKDKVLACLDVVFKERLVDDRLVSWSLPRS